MRCLLSQSLIARNLEMSSWTTLSWRKDGNCMEGMQRPCVLSGLGALGTPWAISPIVWVTWLTLWSKYEIIHIWTAVIDENLLQWSFFTFMVNISRTTPWRSALVVPIFNWSVIQSLHHLTLPHDSTTILFYRVERKSIIQIAPGAPGASCSLDVIAPENSHK